MTSNIKEFFINVQKDGTKTSSVMAQTEDLEIAKEITKFFKKEYPKDKFFITTTICVENIVVECD